MDELVLDRYRLIERLAVGGSAEVWRAHDEQLDRQVAVKRLHPHLLPDEASRKRLAAEARAAAGLSHPVVVGVYDVDTEGEAPSLVMELVDGESLAARLDRDGALPDAEAVALTAEIADALFHAHQQGVIHRDVKPGNVLLGRDGRARLVDFGIAYSLAESAERLTLTGSVIGTLHAMAPEQLADGPITPRTDLYGLGVVLHHALTARPPYPTSSPVALADAQRAGPPQMEGLDPAIASMVRSCLAYDPADRPLHAGALAADLRAWHPGAATAEADTAAITRPLRAPVAAVPVMGISPGAGRRPRPSLATIIPVLGGVLAALLAAVIFFDLGLERSGAGVSPTVTPPSATPIPSPEWLASLLQDVADACGDEVATEVEPQLASLSEDEAKEFVDDLEDECDDDSPGRGRGRGRGNGDGRDDD